MKLITRQYVSKIYEKLWIYETEAAEKQPKTYSWSNNWEGLELSIMF